MYQLSVVDESIHWTQKHEAEHTYIDEETRSLEYLELLLRKKSFLTIEQYMELEQQDKYLHLLEEILTCLEKIKDRNNSTAVEAYYSLSLPLLSCINKKKLFRHSRLLGKCDFLMRCDAFSGWKDAVQYIRDVSAIILKIQNEDQKKKADNTIVFLQKYISNHLDKDLSLVRLAEQVYLNPSYLSRLYKKSSGLNISEYIEHTRIKKAKELLENNDLRVNEIALRVGYENAASFSRVFKRSMGICPQEYRDNCLIGKRLKIM